MIPHVDIASALQRGFQLYRDNLLNLLLGGLLFTVLSIFSLGILLGPMWAGYVLLTLNLVDRRPADNDVSTIFKGFSYFLHSLVLVIVLFVALVFGQFILALIPIIGFFLSIFYGYALQTLTIFAIYLIVDRRMEVVASIQQSIELVKQNFWVFLGLNVVASLISGIGVILCGLGVFLTLPIYFATLAVVYRDFYPAQ